MNTDKRRYPPVAGTAQIRSRKPQRTQRAPREL